MSNLINTNQIPKTIIIKQERQKYDDELRRLQREAQQAYNDLLKMKDLGAVPEPQQCTLEWLDAISQSKRKAVDEAAFLSTEQKQSQILHWGKTFKKAGECVTILQTFLDGIPSEYYGFDDSIPCLYIKDIDQLIDAKCSREVPVEAVDHLQHIEAVASAIKSLRDWEKVQDVRKFPLESLLSFSTGHLAEQWATGDIKVNHKYDHLPGIKEDRELTAKQFI